jgi:hypothetical protein
MTRFEVTNKGTDPIAPLRHVLESKKMARAILPDHVFHIAEPDSVASILEQGLLSTERLLRAAKIPKATREKILGEYRPASVVLDSGAVIRDQTPMPPKALERALLDSLTPQDWYRTLNGFVFLWADKERVVRHQSAIKRKQSIMVFDARRLFEELGHKIYFSPINSGNARRKAALRSRDLFVPYREWVTSGWRPIGGVTRSPSTPPAEIVLKDAMPVRPYLLEIT